MAKLYLAPDRLPYLRSHWFEVIIIVLPFLRPLRLLWLPIVLARLWKQSQRALRRKMPAFIGGRSLVMVLITTTLMFIAERGSGGPITSFTDTIW
ncbi:MAG: hypothetical protein ACUVSL_05535 [Chloroflexus sp.]|uniref:hypothetical protein n=1 Tax=Chloroflexus sp. TaxID=1904827 RepID=UPI00404A0DFF